MRPIVIISPRFTKLMSVVVDVYAITIFPFIISKEEMSEITLNHETIHIQQQKELFVLGFYPLYFFFYLWGFIKYKDKHQAYYRIPFEQEAFENDQNLNYLKDRKSFSWREFKV